METEFLRLLAGFSSIFTPIIWILTIAIHVIFAAAVARHGGMLHRQSTGTVLVGPIVWAFAVLLGGVFVAGMYWLIHHSALSRGRIIS
jgi:hypothetical protein